MASGDPVNAALSRLGTIKNPVLLTSSTFSTGMMYYAHDLVQSSAMIASVTGAAAFLSSALIFLSGVGFYVYAYIHLPASTQELVFLQEAKVAIERHKTAEARAPRRRVKPVE